MAETLVVAVGAKTDDSSSTVEDFDSDLLSEVNPHIYENVRTISPSGRLAGPVLSVVVADAVTDLPSAVQEERYQRRKPVFLRASITKRHLVAGESTNVAPELRTVIRARGKNNDDCGHIIGRALNGFMVDYNLFPQQMNINRGWFGNYVFWKALETAMRLWLTIIPATFAPRVEFNMLLTYDNNDKPDRPNKFKYLVKFYVRLRKPDGDEDEKQDGETEMLKAGNEILNIAKQCIKRQSRSNLRIKILDVIRRFDLREVIKIEILALVKELEDILEAAEPEPEPEPRPEARAEPSRSYEPRPTSSTSTVCRYRPSSVIDLVPFVGGARSVYHGAQDFYDGNILKGIGNTALGVGSLAADTVSFGALSTIGKSAVKGTALAATTTVGTSVFMLKTYARMGSFLSGRH